MKLSKRAKKKLAYLMCAPDVNISALGVQSTLRDIFDVDISLEDAEDIADAQLDLINNLVAKADGWEDLVRRA